MKSTDRIREILDEIDASTESDDDRAFAHNFDALEIPDLVCTAVDFLQPSLLPYEGVIFWHMFRKSILGSGTQYARVSTRGLTQGVITSASGQSDGLSYGAVQKALAGLEEKKVISKTGETNREGTLYKVHLPEEIDWVREKMEAGNREELPEIDIEKELDYYNVKENRLKVFDRDDYKCQYCKKQLTRFTATLDHVQPVSKGGDNSYENLITSCLHCNSQRGNKPVMDFIADR